MTRRQALAFVVPFGAFLACLIGARSASAQAPEGAHDKAAAALQEIGGKVERDDKAPGKPILVIGLATQPVTDDKLACLEGLDTVKKLTLNTTKITDAALDHLKGMTGLQKLYLVDTAVTDSGAEKLKDLKQLEVLSLVGTQVGDAGLEHLKGLENLKLLFLAGTKVTDDGVKKLQEALPKLKIER